MKHQQHKLKCDYKEFLAITEGWKTFEVRLADRDYGVHDTLVLEAGEHTSVELKILAIVKLDGVTVPPVTCEHWWSAEDAARFGLVVLGFEVLDDKIRPDSAITHKAHAEHQREGAATPLERMAAALNAVRAELRTGNWR